MKIGFALGAGGARGLSYIGAIRTLAEYGVEPDIIAGTSIGAIIGGCMVCGSLDCLEETAVTMTKKRVISLLDFSFGGSSLITGKKLRTLLEKTLIKGRFEDSPLPFGVVATEVGSGHELWLRQGDMARAINASYALPGVFEPVKIGRSWLIDGALCNPVPVTLCRAMGADVVIAFSVVADSMYRAKTMVDFIQGETVETPEERTVYHNLWRLFGSSEPSRNEDKAPSVGVLMADGLDILLDRVKRARMAGDPPDIHIQVRLLDAGMWDFTAASSVIKRGREAASGIMPSILSTLGRACPIAISNGEPIRECSPSLTSS